jgi:formamidopyrimidine-DNA glycosylase
MINMTDEAVVKELKESGMSTEELSSPDYPALTVQLLAYKEAIIKWKKAGRPTRSKEEVDRIHNNYCLKCDWYDKEKKRCRGCGCKVTKSALAIFNKIKMATEHCPKEYW